MLRSLLLIPLLAALASSAQAQTLPYYLGVVQAFTYVSNVYNAPTGTPEVSDVLSTTTLRGGVSATLSRQRLYANASVSHNRLIDQIGQNSNGYQLNVGADWVTVGNLSGNVNLLANQTAVNFNPGVTVGPATTSIERALAASASARWGMTARTSLDAGVNARRVDYSATQFAIGDYDQVGGQFGVNHALSGALSVGTGVSASRTRYPTALLVSPGVYLADSARRGDVYATANWVPTAASSLTARVNFGKTEYERTPQRDFTGVTGLLAWAWQPTAKLKLTTTAARDTGRDSSFAQRLAASTTTPTLDFSRLTDTLALRADYALTAKVVVDAGVALARRDLVDLAGVLPAGTDTTTIYSLGARWAPTRALGFGCYASHTARSAASALSSSYGSNALGCYGSFTLQ